LTEQRHPADRDDKFAFYMDLLGHDILNNNQAVLGYLELILAAPGNDRNTKKFAEKAVSHVRTSTILIENIKRLLATRAAEPDSFKPLALQSSLSLSERELIKFFPDKRLKVRVSSSVERAFVVGNSAAQDLIMNSMVNMVRLDPNDEVNLSIELNEVRLKGNLCWRISLEDPNAELPFALRGRDVESIYLQDSSTAVKLSGVLFAKMIAQRLGGDFEAHEHQKGQQKGATFVITLRKASGL
jgi:hypothetical protein